MANGRRVGRARVVTFDSRLGSAGAPKRIRGKPHPPQAHSTQSADESAHSKGIRQKHGLRPQIWRGRFLRTGFCETKPMVFGMRGDCM
jgi:hypothetical protein